MKHCQNCNRDYSNKYFRKHCGSNNDLKKAFGVKFIYKTENILVNEIDNTPSYIVKKHTRKIHSFLMVCKINNKKVIGYPKRVLLKNYDKDVKINDEFNCFSIREDISFNYCISQSKLMLETMMIKNLDKNPERLKKFEYRKAPFYEYLILKNYGLGIIHPDNRLVFCVRGD